MNLETDGWENKKRRDNDKGSKNRERLHSERDEGAPSIRLGLSANGISIQRKTSASGGWEGGNVTEVGVVRLTTTTDSQGHVHTSFMVTDDPTSVPEGIPVSGVTAYHLAGRVTDENGQDPANLGLNAANLTDEDSHIRSSYGRGSYRGEGLPNLWGAFNLSSTQYDDTANPQGVFWQTSSNAHADGGGSYNNPYSRVDFNAQRFNPIYGSSAHVTPVNTAIRIWKRTS